MVHSKIKLLKLAGKQAKQIETVQEVNVEVDSVLDLYSLDDLPDVNSDGQFLDSYFAEILLQEMENRKIIAPWDGPFDLSVNRHEYEHYITNRQKEESDPVFYVTYKVEGTYTAKVNAKDINEARKKADLLYKEKEFGALNDLSFYEDREPNQLMVEDEKRNFLWEGVKTNKEIGYPRIICRSMLDPESSSETVKEVRVYSPDEINKALDFVFHHSKMKVLEYHYDGGFRPECSDCSAWNTLYCMEECSLGHTEYQYETGYAEVLWKESEGSHPVRIFYCYNGDDAGSDLELEEKNIPQNIVQNVFKKIRLVQYKYG